MPYTTSFVEAFGQQVAVTTYEPTFDEWLSHEMKMARDAGDENHFFNLVDSAGIEDEIQFSDKSCDESDFTEDPEKYQELVAYTGTYF